MKQDIFTVNQIICRKVQKYSTTESYRIVEHLHKRVVCDKLDINKDRQI